MSEGYQLQILRQLYTKDGANIKNNETKYQLEITVQNIEGKIPFRLSQEFEKKSY